MIDVALSDDQTLTIDTPVVTLRDGQPVLNGTLLQDWTCEVLHWDSEGVELLYTSESLGGGAFRLQADRSDTQLNLRYGVEGLQGDFVLDSFGIRFEQVENVRQFLRNGYLSWDGSYYVQPDSLPLMEEHVSRSETGFGMSQFLPRHGSGSLIIGFDRHDRFQQTFTFDLSRQPLVLTIQTWWDRKDRSEIGRCESEQLVIFSHPEIENGLREWARLVANASPASPRLSSPPITG